MNHDTLKDLLFTHIRAQDMRSGDVILIRTTHYASLGEHGTEFFQNHIREHTGAEVKILFLDMPEIKAGEKSNPHPLPRSPNAGEE